jgi:hypothetical protein
MNTVKLPSDVTRCHPMGKCGEKHTCARYLAPIPAYGASVADFSLYRVSSLPCQRYIDASDPIPEPKPVREVKPWPTA